MVRGRAAPNAGPPALPRHRRAVRGQPRCRRRRHRAHRRVNVHITPTP